jgi:RNA polymerase sigma-70 factor (ECF subfamily)
MNTVAAPPEVDVAQVWRELRGPLLRFITRRVPDHATAEDLLQEVILRLHRHAGELRSAPAVSGWLHEIARNAIIDHYRRAAVQRERPAGMGADLDAFPPLAAREETSPVELRAELAACLHPLLDRLPAIYREAVSLTDLDGLTQADAAARLGISTSGMKSRVQRGRAQLKDLLQRCCEIELDRRGAIIDYRPTEPPCGCSS